jgi:hypothetical protein
MVLRLMPAWELKSDILFVMITKSLSIFREIKMPPDCLKNRDYTKMDAIMKSLGCSGKNGVYVSPDLHRSFDLTAIADNKILQAIARQMNDVGYRSCKQELREFLEV